MAFSALHETDANTWTFRVRGFHLDAPQHAKSSVYERNDVDYDDLRAKVVGGGQNKFVVVVET